MEESELKAIEGNGGRWHIIQVIHAEYCEEELVQGATKENRAEGRASAADAPGFRLARTI